MKSSTLFKTCLAVLLCSVFSSCAAIAGIFKAGMGFGIFLVVLVVIVIVVLVGRAKK